MTTNLSINPKLISEEVGQLQQKLKDLGYDIDVTGCFEIIFSMVFLSSARQRIGKVKMREIDLKPADDLESSNVI